MSVFELIDSLNSIQKLRKVYNNLPGNVDLLSQVTAKHSHEDLTYAKTYALERINELKEKDARV